MLKVCVTGHRPEKIGGYDSNNPTREWVKHGLAEVVDKLKPNYAYIGMAQGVDQDFAWLCNDRGIPYTAALPFEGQETKWSEAAQIVYWRLIAAARATEFVCRPGFAAWKYQRRNEWMVDSTDEGVVIAVWDGSSGGTSNCVRYAQQIGCHVVRLDPKAETIEYPKALKLST